MASAAWRIFCSSTAQPQQFQLFQPKGGVQGDRIADDQTQGSGGPRPDRLRAISVILYSPRCSSLPVMQPVSWLTSRPSGRFSALKSHGTLSGGADRVEDRRARTDAKDAGAVDPRLRTGFRGQDHGLFAGRIDRLGLLADHLESGVGPVGVVVVHAVGTGARRSGPVGRHRRRPGRPGRASVAAADGTAAIEFLAVTQNAELDRAVSAGLVNRRPPRAVKRRLPPAQVDVQQAVGMRPEAALVGLAGDAERIAVDGLVLLLDAPALEGPY